MLSFTELNKTWQKALRQHALEPLQGDDGPYRAIGDKHVTFLDDLWQARRKPLPDIGAMIEAGGIVRFWSDPHVGHEAILRLANRTEFADVETMDAALLANLDAAVGTSDLVVCLGDLTLKNSLEFQRRLVKAYGDRHLTIVGNHDNKGAAGAAWAARGALASLAFSLPVDVIRSWITENDSEMAELVDWSALPRRVNFGCSHWPVPIDRLPGPGWINLHGHVHNKPTHALGINFSVEAIAYRPVTLQETISVELVDNLVRRQQGLLE